MNLVVSSHSFSCHFCFKIFSVNFKSFICPEKIAMTVPFVFGKVAHLLHVRIAELASTLQLCASVSFLFPLLWHDWYDLRNLVHPSL